MTDRGKAGILALTATNGTRTPLQHLNLVRTMHVLNKGRRVCKIPTYVISWPPASYFTPWLGSESLGRNVCADPVCQTPAISTISRSIVVGKHGLFLLVSLCESRSHFDLAGTRMTLQSTVRYLEVEIVKPNHLYTRP